MVEKQVGGTHHFGSGILQQWDFLERAQQAHIVPPRPSTTANYEQNSKMELQRTLLFFPGASDKGTIGTTGVAAAAVFSRPRRLRGICSGIAGDGVHWVTEARWAGVRSSVPSNCAMAVAAGDGVANNGRYISSASDAQRPSQAAAVAVRSSRVGARARLQSPGPTTSVVLAARTRRARARAARVRARGRRRGPRGGRWLRVRRAGHGGQRRRRGKGRRPHVRPLRRGLGRGGRR